jgi:hypothetical protein
MHFCLLSALAPVVTCRLSDALQDVEVVRRFAGASPRLRQIRINLRKPEALKGCQRK